MNNKIKELAVLSGVVEAHVNWDAAGGNFLEKFAELIIQECMEQCFSEDDEQRIAKYFGYHIEEEDDE